MRLKEFFFNRDTVEVAKDLLGKFLIRKIGDEVIEGMIIETEAYCGPEDLAAHSSKGLTPRTKVMFGPPGLTYIYLVYGMYHCLNFVTREEGVPQAVLIRGVKIGEKIWNGPGKLCREMKIDRGLNGLLLENEQLWIEDRGVKVSSEEILASKRIGIDYAKEWKDKLWRFQYKPKM
jgi:DNA-3-methyladenine glycosylase